MDIKTPLTIITGSLGSGKTTLLKHILDNFPRKLAILMNEFGELNIDGRIIRGKNVAMTELEGGCVCCSLLGEFEEAVTEIIETVEPDYIIVETTGVAEPDALVFDIQESLPQIRLDGILTIVDADLMLRYPQLGHTTRMQIEDADIIALNKTDLATDEDLDAIEEKLKEMNSSAAILGTQYCRIDPDLLFGLSRNEATRSKPHKHQLEYKSVSYETDKKMDYEAFQKAIEQLKNEITRAKGFIKTAEGTFLFNFVNGRWELEPCDEDKGSTALVFIAKKLNKDRIIQLLQSCEG